MSIAFAVTRPEAIGALSIAGRHRRAAEHLRRASFNRPGRRRELIDKHKSKEQRMLRRAERMEAG